MNFYSEKETAKIQDFINNPDGKSIINLAKELGRNVNSVYARMSYMKNGKGKRVNKTKVVAKAKQPIKKGERLQALITANELRLPIKETRIENGCIVLIY